MEDVAYEASKLKQAVLLGTMVSTNRESNHVLVEDKSSVRIITLNRPNQLNALSSAMGKGRAFCAGADVAEVVHHINQGSYGYDPASSRKTKRVKIIIPDCIIFAVDDARYVFFFRAPGDWKSGANISRKELTMNYVMATYSKPQVSILNGIVMGGGAGASIHGRFRIATENTLFAMPETALGLFPDVGASYFLSRLPGFFDFVSC
ncbi:3-hydroxyisobutyryl-CoA hydrolase 1 [Orobanche hederae]